MMLHKAAEIWSEKERLEFIATLKTFMFLNLLVKITFFLMIAYTLILRLTALTIKFKN